MTTAGDSPFNRRRFLLGGGVFGLGLLGASCSSDSSSGGAAPTPPSEDVWSVLKTLRELARSSPDHLAARFAEAIAAKSPENLVRLVQERVRVLPTDGADVLWSCRWGASGALRAAAGTPRERMDLLAAALKALGAVTRVVSASLPASVTADGLYRDASPVFALDAAKLASLRGSKLAESLAKLPTSGTEPDPTATAEKLLRAIPVAQATAKHRAMQTLPSKLPVVEFTLAGVTRWAYAIADLGIVTATPEGLTGELTEADIPSVSLRVLGALGDLPSAAGSSSLTELVSGTWRADRVAGRKVVLTFPPPGDPRSGFGQKLESVPIRVPSLVLTEPDPPGPGQAEPFS
ncbi:MAG TPA: hypothetical protein VFQ35_00425, partial [Polyangiaceae bacterium]|nr:hypothetical protein [Polyangiaceae bacterium]